MHQINPKTANELIESVQAGKMLPHDAMRAAAVFAVTSDIGKSTITSLLMYSLIGLACSAAIASPAGFLVGAGGFLAALFQKAASARSQGRAIVRMSDAELVESLADNDAQILQTLIDICPQLTDRVKSIPTAAALCDNPAAPSQRSNLWDNLTASPPTTAGVDGNSVAVLERTYTQTSKIGLPPPLVEVTVIKPYSTFIFGQPEAGKDITLYNIMTALRQQHPNAYFVGIDGKNHAPELPLWDIYDDALHISMRDQPTDYHHRLMAALTQAIDDPGMAFIAFSEMNGISSAYATAGMTEAWREVAHLIAYLAIQGNAAGKYLYATAQALNLDALGIRKESRANCAFIAIANSTQYSFLSQIAGDTKVFNAGAMLNQPAFQSACSRSTATQHLKTHDVIKGIAYFHTSLNRWEPMPRLVNPGADRCDPPAPAPHTAPLTPVAVPDDVSPSVPIENAVTQAAAIEVEELIDHALDQLYSNPGKQFSLTKLFNNKSQRARLSTELIAILKDAEGIEYKPRRNGAITSHYFVAIEPDGTGPDATGRAGTPVD